MSHHQLNTLDDVCVCFPNRQMLNIKDSIQSEKRDEKYQKKTNNQLVASDLGFLIFF